MKQLAFAVIFAVSSFTLHAQNAASDEVHITKSFRDASPKKITATTSHGNIAVSAAPASQTRVEVSVYSNNYNQKLSKQEVQKKLDEEYVLDISLSGDVLNVSARLKKVLLLNEPRLNISFVIYAPGNAANILKTDHGNIDLSGFTGNEDARTDHGDVTISKIMGKVVGRTDHGNVTVSDCKDDIDVSTDHGDITGSNCTGTIKLITDHGNIELKDLTGKVRAGTDHGDVSGNHIGGTLTASTSHGNINLVGMSAGVSASTDHGDISMTAVTIAGEVALSNSNGNVSLDLPNGKGLELDLEGKEVSVSGMQNFNGSKSKDHVQGSLNGGGTKISVKTNRDARVSL